MHNIANLCAHNSGLYGHMSNLRGREDMNEMNIEPGFFLCMAVGWWATYLVGFVLPARDKQSDCLCSAFVC
jgi:hypothetical protein